MAGDKVDNDKQISNFRRRLEEVDGVNTQLIRGKTSTVTRIDEMKRQVDEESKAKVSLTHELQSQNRDNDMFR